MRTVKWVGVALGTIIFAATAVLFGIYHHYDQERLVLDDTARQSAEARAYGGSYVRLGGGVTHYELSGPTGAPTVVLVHGFSVPYYIWDPTFDALTADFRVLRYDLFGRGWSDRPEARYDADFYDQQLVQLLGALDIRGPVDIVGVSMGGPIAVNYAARHPERVRKVVLFDPAYGKGIMPPLWLRAPLVSDFVANVRFAPRLADSQREDFVHPDRFPDYFTRYKTQMRYRGFRHALLSTIRDFVSQDNTQWYAQLGESGKPVLLVWGRADETTPVSLSDELRKTIPHAEFHPIDDAAHVPFYEHPEVVNRVLIEFLRR